MKKMALLALIVLVTGCSSIFGPRETKEFKLPARGGYRGTPVGSCSQRAADEECRNLGWKGAVDWDCGTVHVSGGFWGDWDQSVMYCVTCYR